MNIPKGITRADVLDGIRRYDAGERGDFGASTKYDLIFGGRRYPPKAILGLSTYRLLSQALVPGDFAGGEDSTCFKILRSLEFEVAPKDGPAGWIFQGNPDEFDIEGYIRNNDDILWYVGQEHYKDAIVPGQPVFFWLAKGASGKNSGVIATGRIVAAPALLQADEASRPFARAGFDSSARLRVPLKVLSRRLGNDLIKREWCKGDPILHSTRILRQAAGTNFPLSDVEVVRLQRLNEKTGYDFTHYDSMVALLAYAETYGGPLSLKPDSPIARAALVTGRVISSIYNKVLNYRAIDPREKRKGLSGGSELDELIWTRFYDSEKQQIMLSELRLAVDGGGIESNLPLPSADSLNDNLRKQVHDSLQLSGEERRKRLENAPERPKVIDVVSKAFVRNPDVIAEALERANGTCGICRKPAPFIRKSDGSPYLEVHHRQPLAAGGKDTVENSIALCPNCHRNEHFGTRPVLLPG